MLCAAAIPIMSIYTVYPYGAKKCSGSQINFKQDNIKFASELPNTVSEIPFIWVNKAINDGTENKIFKVRRQKVLNLLQGLKYNETPWYENIRINYNKVEQLPEDGIPSNINHIEIKDLYESQNIKNKMVNKQKDSMEVDKEQENIVNNIINETHSMEVDENKENIVNNIINEQEEKMEIEEKNTFDTCDVKDNNVYNCFIPISKDSLTEKEAVNNVLNWPTREEPLNEFTTPYLMTACFPTLFPNGGRGDPTNAIRTKSISLSEAVKHLLYYPQEKTDGSIYYRFAEHHIFGFWCNDMIRRHRALEQCSYILNQNPEEGYLSISEMQKKLEMSSKNTLLNKIQRYSANIRGSVGYWRDCKRKLKQIFYQLGAPTIFWTYSFADYHLYDLHRLLGTLEATQKEKQKKVNENPHIVSAWFYDYIKQIKKKFHCNTLEETWSVNRWEWQGRGTGHVHGCSKLKNDPGLISLCEKIYIGREAKKKLETKVDSIQGKKLLKQFEMGLVAEQRVISYVDTIITAWNTHPEFGNDDYKYEEPIPHPSSIPHRKIDESKQDEQYQIMFNCLLRHKCTRNYCLRKNKNNKIVCRFEFPKDVNENTQYTEINFKKTNNNCIPKVIVQIKRNDPWSNTHNRLQLEFIRGNCDMSIVADQYAVANYLAKYITKTETGSQNVKVILQKLLCTKNPIYNQKEIHNMSSIWRKLMLKLIGTEDISQQQCMHELLGFHMFQTDNISTINVNLNASRQLKTNKNTGKLQCKRNIVDIYANRLDIFSDSDYFSELENINLHSFIQKFQIKNINSDKPILKIRRNKVNVVISYIPYFNIQNKETFADFAKFELIKYNPWKNNIENAYKSNNIQSTEEKYEIEENEYIYTYTNFMKSKYATDNLPSTVYKAVHYSKVKPDFEEYCEQEEEEENFLEDWQEVAANAACNSTELSTLDINDPDYNWNKDYNECSIEQINSISGWIQQQKLELNKILYKKNQFNECNAETLTGVQKQAYTEIINHHKNNNGKQLLKIIYGSAGTGKSYLIKCLKKKLKHYCVITATTGVAAFGVGGCTLHSLTKLPVRGYNWKDLTGNALKKLQHNLQGIKYLIIDEMSMLGQNSFYWLDRRLRQATAKNSKLFGGINIILVGDFAQIPPVGDSPLWLKPFDDKAKEKHTAYACYRQFSAWNLQKNQRQKDDNVYNKLLMNLRNGKLTEEQYELLSSRQPRHVNIEKWKNAIRIFDTNKRVFEYNIQKLKNLNQKVAKIEARHTGFRAKQASVETASGLSSVLFLSVGSRVMLSRNLWSEAGLVNGAMGTIYKILYKPGSKPSDLPVAVLVKFDKFLGKSFIKEHENIVPIVPEQIEWFDDGKSKTRTQLPMNLSFAITIHKSQGKTLDKAWIDVGKKEVATGASFVALSRLKSLKGLILNPYAMDRYIVKNTKNKKKSNLFDRIKEEKRLKVY